MNEQEMKKVIEEMKGLVVGSRVEKIARLDEKTLVILLSGNIKVYYLVMVFQKRSSMFHCLFERIHPDYIIQSRISSAIESIIKKGTIESLYFHKGIVEIGILAGEIIRLWIDFTSGVLSINQKGEEKVTFSFFNTRKVHSSASEEAVSSHEPDELTVKCGISDALRSFDGVFSMPVKRALITPAELPLNEKLSRQFIECWNRLLSQRALKVIRSEQKKVSRLVEKLMVEKNELDEKERYRVSGELLKYNLHLIARGMKTVTLSDYSGNKIEIALDETLSPYENMQRYFDRYRKLKRKEEVFSQKLSYELKRLEALDSLITRLFEENPVLITKPLSEFINSLDERFFRKDLIERLRRVVLNKPVRVSGKEEDKKPYLVFYSRTGKTILVGKEAGGNEELTLKVARGNDLWFHVEEGGGSHVILQYKKGCEFEGSDIIDAATLALYFSKLRQAGRGNVVYTFRKYVKKPKGSKQGYVTYYRNKTKHVVIDEKILQKLISSRGTIFQVLNDLT